MQRATARSGSRPTIAGAHLEGPFLGGAPGAHRRELIVAPDLAWIEGLPDVVTLMTVGPEAEGVLQAIAALDRRGIVVSVGHSAANHAQTVAAIEAERASSPTSSTGCRLSITETRVSSAPH